MKFLYFMYLIILISQIPYYLAKNNEKNIVLDQVVDMKDFKKVLRTKTNVLVCFTNSLKHSVQVVKILKEAAIAIKGQGTMVLIDCSSEAKKICKKVKVLPETYILKHYKDGEFNRDYDRKETVNSIINFMRDPTGDLPWEEDITAKDVLHIADANNLARLIKKEQRPIMIMFYAPWCAFCKSLKPEYSAAASELQGHSVLAAIDVNRPENVVIRSRYNITAFPTLLYYLNGAIKYHYEGENTKVGIVNFMKDPQSVPVKVKEPEWSDLDSEVVHLTSSSFDLVIKEEPSILVMFYAPWCGHCKRMKPEYERAATQLKAKGIPGMLAAVDATKEQSIANRYSIKGYPTVKYFSYGELKYDVNLRESPKIVEFMHNPQEPPLLPPVEVSWSDQNSQVIHLTEDNFKSFLKKKKHVLVMFYAPWCGHCKKAKPEFTEAAEAFRNEPKIEFAAVDCTVHPGLCNMNGIKGYPTIKYFSYYSKVVKQYSGGRTAEEFVKFMTDSDNPSPSLIQPNKEGWSVDQTSNVLVLTDKNFKTAISTNVPVLVMFHAPWCGHCEKMKPEYFKAAESMKTEGLTGQLAIFDCIENPDITEEYEISGFPTLKLFINGKFVSDYKGTRTSNDFKQFMNTFNSRKDEL